MKIKYEMETLREIWDNEDGEVLEIGPDRDGLDMIELRYKTKEGKIHSKLTINPLCAELVAKAILECGKELLFKENL